MVDMHTNLGPVDLRLIVSVPRSGSTLLMSLLSQSAYLGVTSRNVLMGNMETRVDRSVKRSFEPDYRVFTDVTHPVYNEGSKRNKKLIVSKEEYGNDRFTGNEELNECNYQIIPEDSFFPVVNPFFLIRKPVDVFNSWVTLGWNDLPSFILSYKTIIDMMKKAESLIELNVITYDELVNSTEDTLKRICSVWQVGFTPEMLIIPKPFHKNYIFSTEEEQNIYTKPNLPAVFGTVGSADRVFKSTYRADVITSGQEREIREAGLIELYEEYSKKGLSL